MSVELEIQAETLTAYLSGEIDHHTAKALREEIDMKIEEVHPKKLILDFSKVSFMDSSGIGLVMGRYKVMNGENGSVEVQNPPRSIKRVMQLAGLDRLANIH